MRAHAFRALVLAWLAGGLVPGTTTEAKKNPPKPTAQHINALYYANW